jgi:hypothetical protein
MSDQSLYVLEREVEAARDKLAADLDVLTSPRTFSEFTADLKADAAGLKDQLVDKAKNSLHSTVENFVDELKARAAANPAAVLAIGAGIAWRLVRHPPIATGLIGAGLYSLLTTSAAGSRRTNEEYISRAKERLGEQASDLVSSAKDQAMALGETATQKASELTSEMIESTADAYQSATTKLTEAVTAASDQAGQWTERARTSVEDLSSHVQSSVAGAKSSGRATIDVSGSPLREHWSPPLRPDQAPRDTLLLGGAGVAVAAALGIALQRRLGNDR